MTTKLSDLQLVLLSSAAARADGSLLPPPDSVAGQLVRIRKAIPPLLKRELAAEMDVTTPEQAWRDENDRRIGVVITDAGRTAIGASAPEEPEVAPTLPASAELEPAAALEAATEVLAPARTTKAAQVLALLRRAEGATLAELVVATGWLPHTTRAALTGLRKKGHEIEKSKREDATCYRIAEAA